ncbi:hypothetical protein QQ045_019660 [Rhodiola kirilowii]
MWKLVHLILGALLVAAIDITTVGVLGIQAQIYQNSEPSHTSFKLGIAALILLSIAHLITNIFSSCAFICSKSIQNRNWQVFMSLEFLHFSPYFAVGKKHCAMLTFLPVLLVLGIGTYPNRPSRGSCGFSHLWLLYIGGLSCFVHGIFCIGYFSCAVVATHSERKMIAATRQAAFTAGPTSEHQFCYNF